MFIKELYGKKEPVISFEVFPPKQENSLETITNSLGQMASLNPGFISVTYGAGGTGSNTMTTNIASLIKNKLGATPMAHLTAVAAKASDISASLKELKSNNIFNIMALRGDLPEGFAGDPEGDFKYAYNLIEFIKSHGDFCCGGAFYPEGHIACDNLEDNYSHAYTKQAAGADFLVSQLFFDNEKFYDFADKAQKKGITIPLVAGIMPILGKSQVQRMIFQCGVSLPSSIIRILHKYENSPADLQKAGIEYACNQIEALFNNGHKYIHIYSMNKPEIAAACKTKFDKLVSGGE
ncbi:MAG TPA: methylenetetrahydrofolate reductase [Anaerovoracaceae bacterium]|nr:methylenetetrahydrofolate reductase [Anaerovoracaceae bacterium]